MANKEAAVMSESQSDRKENKADQVIQEYLKNPTQKNTEIANKVGCTQQYSSNTLSRYKREHNIQKGLANTGMKTSTKVKSAKKGSRQGKKPSTTKVPKLVAANRKATTSNGLADTSTILKARHDMECIVGRVGKHGAKALLDDIASS